MNTELTKRVNQAKEETMALIIKETMYMEKHQNKNRIAELYRHMDKLNAMLVAA